MRQVIWPLFALALLQNVSHTANPVANIPSKLIECIIRVGPRVKPNFGWNNFTEERNQRKQARERHHYTNEDLIAFLEHLQSDFPDLSSSDLIGKVGNCAQVMDALNAFLTDSSTGEEI
jgi:hypothetical protein